MLETANLTYDELERDYIVNKVAYDLLLYDYAKMVCEEQKGDDFGKDAEKAVDTYLESLLFDLKNNK